MNDRAIALLEQYDIEVIRTRKGRDGILCETPVGVLVFKEYNGNESHLSLEHKLLQRIAEEGLVKTDTLLTTKEDTLFVKDRDGISYVLKTYYDGRECNIHEKNECLIAMELLAKLHNAMEPEEVSEVSEVHSPLQEYEKRNRELTRIKGFLGKRGQKQAFERMLSNALDTYLAQAKQVTDDWQAYEESQKSQKGRYIYCHGDYQYHNIIFHDKHWHVVNFEKCQYGSPVNDIYLLMRKLLEKSGWSVSLGKELLESYQKVRPISAYDYIDLYYRLAYPEKFWKIANFYYNSRKVWIPEKNMEKLNKVLEQEAIKQSFLEKAFGL